MYLVIDGRPAGEKNHLKFYNIYTVNHEELELHTLHALINKYKEMIHTEATISLIAIC